MAVGAKSPAKPSLIERLLAPLDVPYDDARVLARACDLAELHALAEADEGLQAELLALSAASFWAHLALLVWTHDEKAPAIRYKPFSPLRMYNVMADWCDERRPDGTWAHPIVGVEKSRQLMLSWFAMARLDWCCLYNRHAYTFVVSENNEKAKDQVRRIETVHGYYPPWYRRRAGVEGALCLTKGVVYPNLSQIRSVPQASGRAAASYVPTMGLSDEAAHQAYFESNWTSIKGTCGPTTQMFVISSAAPSWFQTLLRDSADGRLGGRERTWFTLTGLEGWRNQVNGIDCLRVHYTADPARRTAEWKREALRGMAMHQWRQEQEIDYTSRGGRPIFDMVDRGVHVTEGHVRIIPVSRPKGGWEWTMEIGGYVHPRTREPVRRWVKLLRATDHGTRNACGTLWVAVDEDYDWFVFRSRKVAGWFVPANAKAIADASWREEIGAYEGYKFDVIDAMQGLPDKRGQVEDLYRGYRDGRGERPLARLMTVRKGPGSRQVGLDAIGNMLLSTLATMAPESPYWADHGYDADHRASMKKYSSLYLGRDVAEPLLDELERARWDEIRGRDPDLAQPETSLDMADELIDCLRYLIATAPHLMRQKMDVRG